MFDTNKSTKGASKLRRDLINAEIANLRDLLPLPQSTRQRLSQLQLMALVCVYVRKSNYFQQVFKRHDIALHQAPTPNIGFSKALSGFLMMLTQNGKLLYISDNAAEYLGHSMEDLLIHGDSVYDIIDKQDHAPIQAELGRGVPQQSSAHHNNVPPSLEGEQRMFLCRMNVSRNARRQMRFGDQKVVLVQGHYLSYLPLCSRNEPVFLATCSPIAMPETRECVVQGATNIFTTIHSMDMKIVHIDKNGEFYLGFTRTELQGVSWYQLLHWDSTREAQNKHRLITQSEQDRSCILLVRMQRRQGEFIWVHVVLQVRDGQDSSQQPVIVCTNQILNNREASVMLTNSWLYHFYSVQSKIQFGLPFEGGNGGGGHSGRSQSAGPYYTHHNHHSHPTTAIPPTLPHPYGTPHIPYSYHSPVAAIPTHQGSGGSPSSTNNNNNHNHNGTTAQHQQSVLSHQQQQQQQQQHQQQQHQQPNNSNGGGEYRMYSFRSNGAGGEPVDYSQSSPPGSQAPTPLEPRCSSTNSSSSGSLRLGSPPLKRRAIARLEPLFIPESMTELAHDISFTELHAHVHHHHHHLHHTTSASSLLHHPALPHQLLLPSSSLLLHDDDSQLHDATTAETTIPASHHIEHNNTTTTTTSTNGVGGTVLMTTVLPSRPARLLTKAALMHNSEPPDLQPLDTHQHQWNLSPPWSDTTAQKVPDMAQQELSPYMTTTPPTPTSAPPPSQGQTFSFDWMPEQFVPIAEYSASCVPCLTSDGIPVSVPVHWASAGGGESGEQPQHHTRLICVHTSDEEKNDSHEHRRSH